MSRPIAGLVCARESLDSVGYAGVREAYIDALEQVAEVTVVLLCGRPGTAVEVLDRLDGLVLGGHQSNVEAAWYDGDAAPGPYDPNRDALALRLIPQALLRGIPVLGICRGLQEINVAFGGSLRDLRGTPLGAGHREDLSLPRDEQYLPRHEVRITPGGLLHQALGAERAVVNSLHRQAIDGLGEGLVCEAVAEDGVIEAVSHGAAGFCLGVQWHPEWYARTDQTSRAVFGAFGRAAKQRSSTHDRGGAPTVAALGRQLDREPGDAR